MSNRKGLFKEAREGSLNTRSPRITLRVNEINKKVIQGKVFELEFILKLIEKQYDVIVKDKTSEVILFILTNEFRKLEESIQLRIKQLKELE